MEKFEEYKYHCRMATRYNDILKDLHLGLPIAIILTIIVFICDWKLGLMSTCIDIALIVIFIRTLWNWTKHHMKELEYEVNELNIEEKREELEEMKKCYQ